MADPSHNDNAFDFLRLLAAFAVVFSHSYALLGLPEPTVASETFGQMGVDVFFALSGYLVCQSWLRDPDVMRFFLRRALRIFPGLFAAVLFTAIVVGGLATTLPVIDYFTRSETWMFVIDNASTISGRHNLPGVFEHRPIKAANGSLWTLRYEALMYILLAFIGLLFNRRFRLVCLASFLVSFATWAVCLASGVASYELPLAFVWRLGLTIDLFWLTKWGAFFFAGSCLHLFRLRISSRAAAALLVAVLLAPASMKGPLLVLAVPYVAVAFAHYAPDMLKRKRPDLSYGMYVYAFPVQQLVSEFCVDVRAGWLAAFVTGSVITACLASLSWHFVEAPALRLKQRLTQRVRVRETAQKPRFGP